MGVERGATNNDGTRVDQRLNFFEMFSIKIEIMSIANLQENVISILFTRRGGVRARDVEFRAEGNNLWRHKTERQTGSRERNILHPQLTLAPPPAYSKLQGGLSKVPKTPSLLPPWLEMKYDIYTFQAFKSIREISSWYNGRSETIIPFQQGRVHFRIINWYIETLVKGPSPKSDQAGLCTSHSLSSRFGLKTENRRC